MAGGASPSEVLTGGHESVTSSIGSDLVFYAGSVDTGLISPAKGLVCSLEQAPMTAKTNMAVEPGYLRIVFPFPCF